jgi:hypothetical protein
VTVPCAGAVGCAEHAEEDVLAAVVPDSIEPLFAAEAFTEIAVGDEDSLLADERTCNDFACGTGDDRGRSA